MKFENDILALFSGETATKKYTKGENTELETSENLIKYKWNRRKYEISDFIAKFIIKTNMIFEFPTQTNHDFPLQTFFLQPFKLSFIFSALPRKLFLSKQKSVNITIIPKNPKILLTKIKKIFPKKSSNR